MLYSRGSSGRDDMIEGMLYEYFETPFVSLYVRSISHLTFVSREDLDGWTAYQHPEGVLYFVHGESVSGLEWYQLLLLPLYLNYDLSANVYRSEHLRRRNPRRHQLLQKLFVLGAEDRDQEAKSFPERRRGSAGFGAQNRRRRCDVLLLFCEPAKQESLLAG